ncbi:hypothetical protein GLOIN_2v1766585 [Rhizophagus clarus]|uniref:Uncharacterized protein n=1 Tax=Rhizophagus clarus TaxID=94130 RepID=A0A8H3M890_9GLOM|nr:hypothetical protein GLOIN_2v1766585 [Rhizophagus clarus]
MHSIRITCNALTSPVNTDVIHYPCQSQETCIQFNVSSPDPNQNPILYAKCVPNEEYREWDNHNNPILIPVRILLDTLLVSSLYAYYNGDILKGYNDRNNYNIIIPRYSQGEKIKYCFNAGTQDIVTAYAAAQKLNLIRDPDSAEFLEPL